MVILSRFLKSLNVAEGSGFVRPSAGFSEPEIKRRSIRLALTASLTNLNLISSHLEAPLKSGELTALRALAESVYRGTGPLLGERSPVEVLSFQRCIASLEASLRAINSADVDDRAIINCRFEA